MQHDGRTLTAGHRQAAPESVVDRELSFYQGAHRIALMALVMHLVVCIGFAPFTDTWLLATGIGVPTTLLCMWLCARYPVALLSRMAVATAFMVFTGLVVQQTRGDLESHFSFFVMLAVLVVYCDWRPIVWATVVIATHHYVFAVMQPLGFGLWVFSEGRSLLSHVIVHSLVGVFEALVLSILAVSLRRLVFGSFRVAEVARQIGSGSIVPASGTLAPQGSEMERAMLSMQSRLADALRHVDDAVRNQDELVSTLVDASNIAVQLASREAKHIDDARRTSGRLSIGIPPRLKAAEELEAMGKGISDLTGDTQEALRLAQEAVGSLRQPSLAGELVTVADGLARRANGLSVRASVVIDASADGRAYLDDLRRLSGDAAALAQEVRRAVTHSREQVVRGEESLGRAVRAADGLVRMVPALQRSLGRMDEQARQEAQAVPALADDLKSGATATQELLATSSQLSVRAQSLQARHIELKQALHKFSAGGPRIALRPSSA